MLQASNPKDLGLLPDRLDRIGEFIQRKYIDTGLLPHGALLIGRGDEIAHLCYFDEFIADVYQWEASGKQSSDESQTQRFERYSERAKQTA